MLGCAAGSMVVAIVTGYCMAMIGATVARNLRQAVFTKAISLPQADFDRFGAPSLITRSTNDVTQLQMFVVMGVSNDGESPHPRHLGNRKNRREEPDLDRRNRGCGVDTAGHDFHHLANRDAADDADAADH